MVYSVNHTIVKKTYNLVCIHSFLEQASWKFKNALELFVHLWEDGQVPDGAFLEYSQK